MVAKECLLRGVSFSHPPTLLCTLHAQRKSNSLFPCSHVPTKEKPAGIGSSEPGTGNRVRNGNMETIQILRLFLLLSARRRDEPNACCCVISSHESLQVQRDREITKNTGCSDFLCRLLPRASPLQLGPPRQFLPCVVLPPQQPQLLLPVDPSV